MSHSETIQHVYEAFGKGDVDTILSHCTDDVEWDNSRVASRECPWNANFSGKAKVPGFFQALGTSLRFHNFTPHTFVEQGDRVIVLLSFSAEVLKNGHTWANDSIHEWAFAPDGRVRLYRHYNDTAKELQAWTD